MVSWQLRWGQGEGPTRDRPCSVGAGSLSRLIDDDILGTFAIVAEPERVADAVIARFGDVVDRLSFYAPYQADPDRWLPVVDALRSA